MRDLPSGTVTLLFSGIEGSTRLLKQLGEHYTEALAQYRSLLRTAIHAHGGREVDTQGDSFLIVFTRASDAVPAAVEMQRAFFAHAWPNDVHMRVRIGLHTGEPQLSEEGYIGLDVHHAARIMSAGHGGQVLLSQTTRDLVMHDLPEGVGLRDLGSIASRTSNVLVISTSSSLRASRTPSHHSKRSTSFPTTCPSSRTRSLGVSRKWLPSSGCCIGPTYACSR
jgi:class 3 adenylate cyclase